MDTLVEVGGVLSSILSTFWTTTVASYGVIPTLILCGLITIGAYTTTKTTVSWIINKIKLLFNRKKNVNLIPQSYQ